MKIIIEKDEAIKVDKEINKYILKHFVVEANEKNKRKLESFSRVLIDVAEDMGLKAYEDHTNYLVGKDY